MRTDNLLWNEDAYDYLKEIQGSCMPIVILSDTNSRKFCLPLITSLLKDYVHIEVQPGEQSKKFQTAEQIISRMLDKGLTKSTLFISLGGGVITDLGGFVASMYKRGIEHISIPTTLLGQTDAALGGKNGVNIGGYKNQAGTINFPKAVLLIQETLKTLPAAEILSGYAETLKHSLIYDRDLWEMLKSADVLKIINDIDIIKRSAQIKLSITQQDPEEKGLRKALNFGHTAGHAIESWGEYGITHGQAVAAGILIESYLSRKSGLLSDEEFNDIAGHIMQWFDIIRFKYDDVDTIINYMINDKKNDGRGINFTSLDGIGKVRIDQFPTRPEIEEALKYYIHMHE